MLGYDNILTSTLPFVKLREIISVAAVDTQQLQTISTASAAVLLTVRGCNYLAWVTRGENSTPSTYIIRNADSYTQ